LLWHVHQFEDAGDDEKLIGVYSSEQDAIDAQNRLSKEAGFRDHPDGFEISANRLGKDHWTEGFVTVD
jgi:homoserine kinase type II